MKDEQYVLSCHVQLHHTLHHDTVLSIRLGNILASKQPLLLSSIPVKLDRGLRSESAPHKDSECLQEIGASTAIVIRTRRAARNVTPIDRVHVGTNDSNGAALVAAREPCDDGALGELMAHKRDCGPAPLPPGLARNLGGCVPDPEGRCDTGLRSVVAIVESREAGEVGLHLAERDIPEELADGSLLRWTGV